MVFEIKDKVAIISGGASGIGLACGKELLKNGLKGLTIADIDETSGSRALNEIETEFGKNKVIFVKTDVTNKANFAKAFKRTVEVFQNLDIVINSAGIIDDKDWTKEIQINCNGVVNGTLLGLEEYLPKYKNAAEGVIINMSSAAGVEKKPSLPIYTGTKFFVVGFSQSLGDRVHYEQTKVKIITLCPGRTETALLLGIDQRTLNLRCKTLMLDELKKQKSHNHKQTPEKVAKAVVKLVKNAESGTVWISERSQEPYEYVYTPRTRFLFE